MQQGWDNKRDKLFQTKDKVTDFEFNSSVTHVFDDMVRRSVPGYQDMLDGIKAFAPSFASAGSAVYDLGCSLGSASLAVLQATDQRNIKLIAVDLSTPMIEQAENRLSAYKTKSSVEFRHADVCETEIHDASFVILNLTLQFIKPAPRLALVKNIYDGLLPGGALLVSEKVRFENPTVQSFLDKQQMDFKRRQGYSDLEIAQKRNALENVMKLDTIPQHLQRFEDAGFEASSLWYQNLNFCSFLAIK